MIGPDPAWPRQEEMLAVAMQQGKRGYRPSCWSVKNSPSVEHVKTSLEEKCSVRV